LAKKRALNSNNFQDFKEHKFLPYTGRKNINIFADLQIALSFRVAVTGMFF